MKNDDLDHMDYKAPWFKNDWVWLIIALIIIISAI